MKKTPLKNPRAEKIYYNQAKQLDELCAKSAQLYNVTLYILRQLLFDKIELLTDYQELIETNDKGYKQINESKLINHFRRVNQVDFRALPSMTAGAIVQQVYLNWWSGFKALMDWKAHPEKYKGKPKLMRYKKVDQGDRFLVPFFRNQIRLKDGKLFFPEAVNLEPIKTRLTELPQMVRLVPLKTKRFKIEIVYDKKQLDPVVLNPDRVIAIDPNVKTLCMVVNNFGSRFFYINGRPLVAINQFFSKKLAQAMSFVGGQGKSKRILQLHYKHNLKVENFIHQITRYLVNYCIRKQVSRVIFGKINGWKQEVELGKRNNQQFVQIPYNKIIEQLKYKLADYGIALMVVEEGYTSKADNLMLEPMEPQDNYRTRRRKAFFSQKGLMHADVNDAIGIMRKELGDACVAKLLEFGLGSFTPRKVDLPLQF